MRPWLRSQVSSLKNTPSSAPASKPAATLVVNATAVSGAASVPALSRSPSGSAVTGRWQSNVQEANKQLATHLQLACAKIEGAARAPHFPTPLADELAAIAVAVGGLRSNLEALKGPLEGGSDDWAQSALSLGHRALRVFAHAKKWNDTQRKKRRHPQSIESLKQGVSQLLEAAYEYMQRLTQAIDYPKNIDSLGSGDVYRIELGEHRSHGALEVNRRADGRFLVKAEGPLLLGRFYPKATAGLEGEVAAAEFLLTSTQESKKAAGIFLRQARSALEGAPAEAAPKEDFGFLSPRLCALNVRGALAEALHGSSSSIAQPLPSFENADFGVRVELYTEGAPELLLYRRLSVGNVDEAEEIPVATSAEQPQSELLIQARTSLPANLGALMKTQPLDTLAKLVAKPLSIEKAECVVSASPSSAQLGAALRTQVTLTGSLDDIFQSGAARDLTSGHVKSALMKAGARAQVRAALEPVLASTVSLGPDVSSHAFGMHLPVVASRNDAQARAARHFHGSAVSAARELARVFVSLTQEFLKKNLSPLGTGHVIPG